LQLETCSLKLEKTNIYQIGKMENGRGDSLSLIFPLISITFVLKYSKDLLNYSGV